MTSWPQLVIKINPRSLIPQTDTMYMQTLDRIKRMYG